MGEDAAQPGPESTIRRMKGSQILAETIRLSGTRAVFFVPTFLYQTLVELAEDPIKRVLCHSEKAAAYMADGYAQATNAPTVVISQGGPGAANLAPGMADAWLSHTPMLALTPLLPFARHQGNSYQEVYTDFEPVTKFDAEVRTADRLTEFLGKAYREMTTGAPRPAHLFLDAALEDLEAEFDSRFFAARYFQVPAFRPTAEPSAVAESVRLLTEAERPAIVCGRGAVVSSAWPEVTALAERLNIPVMTSLGGKGSIDERHPLALGVTGSYRRIPTDKTINEADIVLYVGSHQGGATTMIRTLPRPGARAIHIDISPSQPGFNYPNVVPLIGDAKAVLQQMLDCADVAPNGRHEEWVKEQKTGLAQWREAERVRTHRNSIPIRPEQLARAVVEACPEDTLFVADTGYAAAWAGAYMDLPAGRNYLNCEGSLGWSFPAAIGAKAGVPSRPVVAFTGDGGFWYHFAELETAVRNQLNTVTVILNNRALAYDLHLVRELWPASRDLAKLSELTDIDFARIARDMGAFGIRVTDPGQIAGAMREALSAGVPAVVDVVVDQEAVAPVAFKAGQGSRGGLVSPPAPKP